MTVMTDTLQLPDGTPAAGLPVRILKLAPTEYDEAINPTGELTVVSSVLVQTDAVGLLSVDLIPTADLLPSGTVYQAVLKASGRVVYNPIFAVPASGPVWIGDNLTDPPGTLPTAALGIETTDRIAADTALDSRLDPLEADLALPGPRPPTAHGHPQAEITNLVSDLGGKAADADVVKLTGDQDVDGVKNLLKPVRISRLTWAALTALAAIEGMFSALSDRTRGLWYRTKWSWVKTTGTRVDPADFGAIGDNTPHPLSEFYGSLAAAQVDFPAAVALTDLIDGLAIQAAIDAAEAAKISVSGLPLVDLGSRQYRINTPLTWKSAGIVGGVQNSGTRVYWDGAAGATVVTQALQGSFNRMEHVAFYPGASEPATWLDTSGVLIDVGFRLNEVHFGSCSGNAWEMGRWVNCHQGHLRFDGVRGYGIRAVPGVGQNLSSFAIDGFTYDNNGSGAVRGSGLILVDNSIPDATNLGVMSLRNARIEINKTPDDGWAMVRLKLSATPSATRSLKLEVDSIAYADSVGATNDCILYRETANTTGSEALIVHNFHAVNMAQVLGGTWPADFPRPTVPAIGIGHMVVSEEIEHVASAIGLRPRSSFPSIPLFLRRGAEAENRWQVDDTGKHSWGSGSAVADTELSRAAAGVLLSNGGYSAAGLTGATNASRYVGATNSGAPTTGTFAKGDFVVDRNGGMWVCVTAGTPGTWLSVGGGNSTTVLRSGHFHSVGITFTTAALAKDSIRLFAFYFAVPVTINAVALEITAPGEAGSVVRLGIYADLSGLPGALVSDFGTVAGDAVATPQITGLSVVLSPGLYWFAAVAQNYVTTGPTVRWMSTSSLSTSTGTSPQPGNNQANVWTIGGISGALPASLPTPSFGTGGPRIQFKIA